MKMTLKDKLDAFVEKGFTYDPITGICKTHKGSVQNSLTGKKRNYLTLSVKYIDRTIQVKAHQFAWYFTYSSVPNIIDHINGDTTDNRIANLRDVTPQQNSFNTKSKNYSYHKRVKKWNVQICKDYKKIHIGYYNTEEEARVAAIEAKNKYHLI